MEAIKITLANQAAITRLIKSTGSDGSYFDVASACSDAERDLASAGLTEDERAGARVITSAGSAYIQIARGHGIRWHLVGCHAALVPVTTRIVVTQAQRDLSVARLLAKFTIQP